MKMKENKLGIRLDNSLPSSELNLMNQTFNSNKNIELPFHFNFFFQPGLYAIINTKTQTYYIGEATNLAARLSNHINQFQLKKHYCKKLQKDWNLYGDKSFNFFILEIGPQWSDRVFRLKVERNFIHKYKKKCYNRLNLRKMEIKNPSSKIKYKKTIPIVVNDKMFNNFA